MKNRKLLLSESAYAYLSILISSGGVYFEKSSVYKLVIGLFLQVEKKTLHS